MSWGSFILISGFKRSKSQLFGYWKWFLALLLLQSSNFTHRFPVSPGYALMIIGLKNLSLNWLLWEVFVPLGQPHSSLNWLDMQHRYWFFVSPFKILPVNSFGLTLLEICWQCRDSFLNSLNQLNCIFRYRCFCGWTSGGDYEVCCEPQDHISSS